MNSLVLPDAWASSAPYAGVIEPEVPAEPVPAATFYVLGPGEVPSSESLEAGRNAIDWQVIDAHGELLSELSVLTNIRDLLYAFAEGAAS